MFGAFIRKIFIVMRVLESAQNISTKISSQKTNQRFSVLTVLLVILIDGVIIIPWNLLSPSAPSGKSFKVPNIGMKCNSNRYYCVLQCCHHTSLSWTIPINSPLFDTVTHSSHSSLSIPLNDPLLGDVIIDGYQCNSVLTESFTLILVAYKVALTGVGAVIAFRVRSLDSIVGESTMMLYSTYNLIVSGILLLLISFIAVIEPATWVIVASAISCGAVTFSLCILFIPKVYIQYKQVTIVASYLFHSAASRHLESHADRKREVSMILKANSGDKEQQEKGTPSVSMEKKLRRDSSSSAGRIHSVNKVKPNSSDPALVIAAISSL